MAKKTKETRQTRLPSDAELLQELASLDEAEVWMPTDGDQRAGSVPEWCELVLHLRRGGDFPCRVDLPLRRHDAELIIEVLRMATHPQENVTVHGMIWQELDAVIEHLMAGTSESRRYDRGVAAGLTLALAIMVNPYAYDTDAVRDEAMERWSSRH